MIKDRCRTSRSLPLSDVQVAIAWGCVGTMVGSVHLLVLWMIPPLPGASFWIWFKPVQNPNPELLASAGFGLTRIDTLCLVDFWSFVGRSPVSPSQRAIAGFSWAREGQFEFEFGAKSRTRTEKSSGKRVYSSRT